MAFVIFMVSSECSQCAPSAAYWTAMAVASRISFPGVQDGITISRFCLPVAVILSIVPDTSGRGTDAQMRKFWRAARQWAVRPAHCGKPAPA